MGGKQGLKVEKCYSCKHVDIAFNRCIVFKEFISKIPNIDNCKEYEIIKGL